MMRKRYLRVFCLNSLAALLTVGMAFGAAQDDAGTGPAARNALGESIPKDPAARKEFFWRFTQTPAIETPGGIDLALLGLKDSDPEVRGYAARGLHVSPPDREAEVVDALVRRLQDASEVREVKYEALLALRNVASPETVQFADIVVAQLQSQQPDDAPSEHSDHHVMPTGKTYRLIAAEALLFSGDPKESLPVLETLTEPVLKEAVLAALTELGAKSEGTFNTDEEGLAKVRAYVLDALDEADPGVRKAAILAARGLLAGGQPSKAQLESNRQVRDALVDRSKTETEPELASGIRTLLSLYDVDAASGHARVPLPAADGS